MSKILVVDDDIDFSDYLKRQIVKHNYEGIFCATIAQAVDHLNNQKFDCVILDINLGTSTSAEALVKIKSDKKCINYQVPVVMLSAFYRKETMTLLQNKVDAVISKPLNVEHFFEIIQNLTSEGPNKSTRSLIRIQLEKIFILFKIISDQDREKFEKKFLDYLKNLEAEIFQTIQNEKKSDTKTAVLEKDKNKKTSPTAVASTKKINVVDDLDEIDVNDMPKKGISDDEFEYVNNDKNFLTSSLQNLVEQVDEIDNRNRFGQTSLMLASRLADYEQVKKLLEKGASTKARANDGKTALHFAVLSGSTEVTELLLKLGGKNTMRDKQGLDPMSYAILDGRQEIIKALIKSRVNLSFKNTDGQNYLMMAVLKKNGEAIELLLKAGANLTQVDNQGKNLYWYLRKSGSADLAMIVDNFVVTSSKNFKS